MNKIIFIVQEHSENFRRIEFIGNVRNEDVLGINDIKVKIYEYESGDIIIHDMPISIYNPKLKATKATITHINNVLGVGWKSFLTQFDYIDFIELFQKSNLPLDILFKTNNNINDNISNKYNDFIKDVLSDLDKKVFFGSGTNYSQYSIDLAQFYDFLSYQNIPDIDSLNKRNLNIDTLNHSSFSKFILSLNLYEGYAVCSSLITDEIQLDELNIFNKNSEIIIPFNLFKYIFKYKRVNEAYIKEFYVTNKKRLNLDRNISKIEKAIKVGELSERSDPLIRLYIRYYYFVFSLKFFKEDIISINLKDKVLETYSKSASTNKFYFIRS